MKNKILQKNINAISKYNLSAVNLLGIDFSDIKNVIEENSNTRLSSIYFMHGSKKYLLQSRYNFEEEAERLIKSIDFDKDSLIIVFGIGLGHHLLKLRDKISKDTRVFIIEYNMDVLKYTLKNIDLTSIFNTPQFFLISGDNAQIKQQIIYQVSSNFYNMVANIQYIVLPNYYIYEEKNIVIMKQIANRLSSYIISFGNSLDDMFHGFRNNYKNIEAFMKSNSIDEIKDRYKNKPAIIVASGPSLQKNIKYLNSASGKALIISCDASLKACELNDVKPDAIASIERDKPTYDYYYKDRKIDKNIVLVGPTVLWPQIYEEYKGKTIIMSKNNEGEEGWWASHFENVKYIDQGQSCATVAFAVAKEAGCNPIILMGQDLAYTDGKIHSDITHTEYEGENNEDKMEIDEVYMKDYEGNTIKSNWIYSMFKSWFENQIVISPQLEVIDSTEGGAYIEGSKVMTLKDTIEKYCTSEIESKMADYLEDITVDETYKLNKYNDLIKDIKKEIKILNKIVKISSIHYENLEKIKGNNKFEKCSFDDLKNIILKMQLGDGVIQKILNSESAVKSYFKQIITQTIIAVKKIGNVINTDNVKRNYELQLSLMYMIKDSSKLIIKEYEKSLEYISFKKQQLEGENCENKDS
ncbi:motility associated factor glycosyltransferase family protein [Clostridium tyrobutyricum]|uniref:motility associated factor glycosyltransferase family protein n=1 Tax=Clostridium tyrobutyricum TaxID=1519 RepID=UPI0018AB794D|nr:6-hydroxymethylpterin diphosphokinase MptE-like protein [Clostridium tyrobutyricum]